MMHRDEKGFGPIAIPPRPAGVAIKDTTDGNTYFLTQTAGGAAPPVVMTLLPSTWDDPIYEADFGPVLETDDGPIRLGVTNGVLGHVALAIAAGDSRRRDAPINTRNAGATAAVYELKAPAGFKIVDATSTLTLELKT